MSGAGHNSITGVLLRTWSQFYSAVRESKSWRWALASVKANFKGNQLRCSNKGSLGLLSGHAISFFSHCLEALHFQLRLIEWDSDTLHSETRSITAQGENRNCDDTQSKSLGNVIFTLKYFTFLSHGFKTKFKKAWTHCITNFSVYLYMWAFGQYIRITIKSDLVIKGYFLHSYAASFTEKVN